MRVTNSQATDFHLTAETAGPTPPPAFASEPALPLMTCPAQHLPAVSENRPRCHRLSLLPFPSLPSLFFSFSLSQFSCSIIPAGLLTSMALTGTLVMPLSPCAVMHYSCQHCPPTRGDVWWRWRWRWVGGAPLAHIVTVGMQAGCQEGVPRDEAFPHPPCAPGCAPAPDVGERVVMNGDALAHSSRHLPDIQH